MTRDPLTCSWWELVALVVLERRWDDCGCDPAAHHRWNCSSSPLWAQTMRDLDINPWTCVRDGRLSGGES